jgi:drug/metabolite transporter (DMT)-like permease
MLAVVSATGWEHPRLDWTSYLVFAIVLTAIGATVVCFSLQTWAQQFASPAHTAILVSLEPVFAALTSLVFAHEHLGGRALGGSGLILAGILLAEWKGSVESRPGEIPA